MSKISRRALARYAADQLLSGKGAAEVAKHLASVMVESGLAGQVEFLLGDIAWELEQRGELTIGKVTTARPLSRELEDQLKTQLKKATKTQEVILDKNIDTSVIGGVKVETPGLVWDDTIARKLTHLRESF